MARNSKSSKARTLLAQGISNKEVARRTGLSIATIYTIRWKAAKKQGLGAIKPQTLPAGAGTGITSVPRAKIPLEFEIIDRPKKKSNNRRNAQLKRWAREREEREAKQAKPHTFRYAIRAIPPQPSLWQRFKGFMVALYAGK